ncbi:CoA transferase [Mycolicibacterium sp. XJ1819]
MRDFEAGDGLLASLRVLDLGGAESDAVGRWYADLGADVLKIEPPDGSDARRALPSVAGAAIAFGVHNANKRSAVLDPADPEDRRRFVALAETADLVVDSGNPGRAAGYGVAGRALAQRFGHLVVLSVTDFGAEGPYASRRATDPVLYAMSTALSRTGPTAGTPVLPPDGVASSTAAAQAAWAGLVAYYHRLRTGAGDYIDFSRFEAVLQSLDPPYGAEGQASSGTKPAHELWRGRPRNQHIYPIFRCKDGHVRICLLSARQWRGMFGWLGEPAQFADPEFDTIAGRYAVSRELNAAIAALFAAHTKEELVAAGQARGVPVAAVLTPAETLESAHFRAVGALTAMQVTQDVTLTAPSGPFVVDGRRAGLRRPAPAPGDDEPAWVTTESTRQPESATVLRPFDGLRILDLGVIVAGGELGRLFADLGAEVIKIESAAYPDGLRQTPPGMTMSRSWAVTHRNEGSLGLDLRRPEGAELFARLVAGADAVFANFKPGTLASLGFSYERLRELNPGIVLAESSAFGAAGPWSERMGYGPLVRATTGVTWLWRSADAEPGTFYDATTIFPDHVSARLTAIAALSALVRRERTGTGAHVHISQAEAAVNQLATAYTAEAARAAGLTVSDDTANHGVYPCEGEDEWCVISLRSDDDRAALAAVIGTDLPADGDRLFATVSDWTSALDKSVVAEAVQRAGVPAAPMNRAVDVPADPQVRCRGLYADMVHPLVNAPILSETGPAPFTAIPRCEFRPAPMPGEHTREICQKVLGMDAAEIDRLLADDVLFSYQGRP